MSIVLTGKGGQIVMAAPGRPMLAAPLSGTSSIPPPPPSPPSPPSPPPPSSGTLTAIAGLIGWWDAGTIAGIADPSGTPITAFGASVGGLTDKSGAGAALAVYHQAVSGTTPPVATSRLNGLLGGIGRGTVVPPASPASGQQLPVMDPDQGLVSANAAIGSGTAWTLFLVWSRPNWRQASTAPSPLLSVNSTVILAADNKTGTGRLTLFPGAQMTVLSTTLTRRHSHAVILRNTPGGGVDVWLDGVRVATGVANPLASTLSAPLLFLHGGAGGGAECWFHEAAAWSLSLADQDIATLVAYQARWTLGARKGVQIMVSGQSNSGNGLNDGAWHLLAQGVAWHLGALAYGVVGNYGAPPGAATCIHGEGIYPNPTLGLSGSFLTNPNDGSDPSTWVLGADGQAVQAWLQSNTDPTDAADIVAIFWPWSEDDSTRAYSEKATYEAAARRLLALERGMLSRSAASLPQLWWSAIPFDYGNNSAGMQMQREVVADMAADATQNVWVVLPQTADSIPRGATYDPATGLWTGGDPLHRDAVDNQRFGCLAAPLVARAVLACGGGDILTSIPASIPALGGPVVTHVYRQSATSLIITIKHDGGTDLIVPSTQAVLGVGWAVLDGGSVASPATVVSAIACARVNATKLLVTLAQPLINASASCRLFYPFGPATIGRGDAVTDNLSAVTPPSGWNIVADLGSVWSLNMPVHVPMTTVSGIALSDAP